MVRLRDVLGSQELLGTGAARSAFTVVVPFDIDSHICPRWWFSIPMLICAPWVWNVWVVYRSAVHQNRFRLQVHLPRGRWLSTDR